MPEDVKEATKLAAQELFGDGQSVDGEGARGFGDSGIIRVQENPHVQRLLASFIHPLKSMPQLAGMRVL